jgi:F-type H+-transporting ATPase subunit epsilon
MSGMTLHLQSATEIQRIADVASFVGTDQSGSFGILPGRTRFMTILDYGLARFRQAEGEWQYLACPGAVLYLVGRDLFVNTRRYLLDADFGQISTSLAGQLAKEEIALASVKENLQRLEQELFRRQRLLDHSDRRE